jgi:hypothetical protein
MTFPVCNSLVEHRSVVTGITLVQTTNTNPVTSSLSLSLSFLSLSLPMSNLSPLFCRKPLYYNFRKHVAGIMMSSVTN